MSDNEAILLDLNPNELQRFWSKVEKRSADECWPWIAAKTFGYGAWRCRKVGFRANRVALILSSGKPLGELDALHRCDRHECCNPAHLFAGTHKKNMEDMLAKGRHWRKGTAKPKAPPKQPKIKPMPELSPSDIERFWGYVEKKGPTDCWLWIGGRYSFRGKKTYGALRVQGETITAHRISYAIAHGRENANVIVRHTCDVEHCANPGHLVGGTQADNIQDQFDRGRARRVPRGEKNPKAKLSDLEVKMIRIDLAAGAKCADLARAYDVSPGTIQDIKWGRTRTHLT
jgi:hypothetical protein